MSDFFDEKIAEFLRACQNRNVKLLMVGGAAVNFHGYRRHSADVDFWIETTKGNLNSLHEALRDIGFEKFSFPPAVVERKQNVSVKISPILDLELITRFEVGKSFDVAYSDSVVGSYQGEETFTYQVISLEDLIINKERSGSPKDRLDILELEKRNKQ